MEQKKRESKSLTVKKQIQNEENIIVPHIQCFLSSTVSRDPGQGITTEQEESTSTNLPPATTPAEVEEQEQQAASFLSLISLMKKLTTAANLPRKLTGNEFTQRVQVRRLVTDPLQSTANPGEQAGGRLPGHPRPQ